MAKTPSADAPDGRTARKEPPTRSVSRSNADREERVLADARPVGSPFLHLGIADVAAQDLAYGDLKGSFVPFRYFYAKALQSGDSLLWEPRVFCGTYIAAQGDLAGAFHPLAWLLYRTFPFDVAINLEFLFNYFWLFLGTFFLLWHLRVPRGAACSAPWCLPSEEHF